ncbi:amidase [Apiospora phragmitis]|uniref:Amidase n=1 Tax=Apiospora phragmitis TaxID=2905665 RepID=A0ABR1W151_9PEZI
MVFCNFPRAVAYLALCLSLQAAALSFTGPVQSLSDISITELTQLLDSGTVTSRDLVDLYSDRIAEVNAELNAVIEIDVDTALHVAETLDRDRSNGVLRGPLHGIPILVKDNYATTGGFNESLKTGAGSVCLAAGSRPREDATVVAKLRAAGAIILGKTNLAEFSGARGHHVPQGWSARGGQTYGAYVRGQTACGSSSGSGVAAGLGLAAAALGTETGGSITCPASFGNVVGVKPTVGLTSRFGVVPVTPRQDTAGPLARSVADAALLLEVMAGRDVERDNYTAAQPWDSPPRYTEALNASALRGKRIGVMWYEQGIEFGMNYWANKKQIRRLFDAALDDLRGAGAELVDVPFGDHGGADKGLFNIHVPMRNGGDYMLPDLKEALARYYDNMAPDDNADEASTAIQNHTQLLACLREDPRERSAEYSLEIMAAIAEEDEPLGPAGGAEAWAAYVNVSTATGSLLRGPLQEQNLEGLVMYMDLAIVLASAPGLPIVTVPMGGLGDDARVVYEGEGNDDYNLPRVITGAPGMPQGLSFVDEKWTEMDLVGFAYAYEQASQRRWTLAPWVKMESDLDNWTGDRIGEL